MRTRLPIAAAQVRLAGSAPLASFGATPEEGIRLPIGDDDDLLVLPDNKLTDQEMSLVRAVANTLATALARRRGEDRMRHEALHDPLTGLPNRTLLGDRLEHALAQSAPRRRRDRGSVRRPRQLQAGQRRLRPRHR